MLLNYYRYGALFIFAVTFSCSNEEPSEMDASFRGISIDSSIESDIPILTPNIDATDECCGVPCHCGEEYERQQLCWKAQTFFCSPPNAAPGYDPGLYQQNVILDTCNEDGVPCTPSGPNDAECQWEVVDMGECQDWLECDPSNPNSVIEDNVPCVYIDENGVEINGVQNFVCQKGKILAGPCNPCGEEVCDSIDNDCDGNVDEGFYPCQSDCGEGLAICLDGELILCDAPLPIPEICDGIDNNCNGDIDEDLIQECHTACESGIEYCIDGSWTGCTAQAPAPEQCNGMDDDCNGSIDENLNCACPPELIGLLIPCAEDPLLCGQGFKTCQCMDDDCISTEMTHCLAVCHWIPNGIEECDPHLGLVAPELCNNFDDDCDFTIDEDLFAECYTGPEETIGVGQCELGSIMCEQGKWGSYLEGLFVEDMCMGEVLPLEEDLCTGQDNNCDGEIEKIMQETDILFIVDTSGSMSLSIDAVQNAMMMFSAHYADENVIQWGLAIGPVGQPFNDETLELTSNLVSFNQFLPLLATLGIGAGGNEMLYDALFLSIRNLVPEGLLPPVEPLLWDGANSNPDINNWNINWRPDAKHVIIVFTDEEGQSYTEPEITRDIIQDWASAADDLSIYTFSSPVHQHGFYGWAPVSVGGSWFPLSSNPEVMFENLMDILDETACSVD